MSTELTNKPVETRSITRTLAHKYEMEPAAFEQTVRATVFKGCKDATREQFAAFCLVCNEYNLNPVLKEIYAFPGKGGGIEPIIGIDGWMNIANSHPAFNGMTFSDTTDEKGNLISITCTIHRKDRELPTSVTEYMAECRRNTEPWKQWPARMLRHKAAIQCIRYAFSLSGVMDNDEYERMFDEERGIIDAPKSKTMAALSPPLPVVEPQDSTTIEATTEPEQEKPKAKTTRAKQDHSREHEPPVVYESTDGSLFPSETEQFERENPIEHP